MVLPHRFHQTLCERRVLLPLALLLGAVLLLLPGSALASGNGAPSIPIASSSEAPVVLPVAFPALLALQQAELTGSNGTENDGFGYAVALSGDTALVGAPQKTVGTLGQTGAAYVFVRSGTSWTQQAELTAADGASGDQFGCAVALSGETAVIGARYKNAGGKTQVGAAYVFVRSGTSWAQQAELTASNAGGRDAFGAAVALDADTAVIGAPGKHAYIGAAYVFGRSGTTWTQQAKLAPWSNPPGDSVGFGSAVALSGDTVLVGADELHTATNQTVGGAYVFVGSGVTWARQALLRAPHPGIDGHFGSAVVLDGNRALIGADGSTVKGRENAGAAYVLVRSGGHWSWQARLTDPHPSMDASFGCAVALSGSTALIGARYKTLGRQVMGGAAYPFVRGMGRWLPQPPLRDLDQSAGGRYGQSVALSGNTTIAGAGGKFIGGHAGGGIAYVDTLVQAPQLRLSASPTSVRVGHVITLSGIASNAIASVRTVQIWRHFPGKTRLYGTATLSDSNTFTWRMKAKSAGTLVLVATYKAGGATYGSGTVTVRVRS